MDKPVDDIAIDEEWLRTLYEILITVYNGTDRPIVSGFPIVLDYDESMLSACVVRPRTVIGDKIIYPHILQRAAVLFQSIIIFHPFVDGNKRSALLATNFYLHWNGYKFVIPFNADDFTKEVAQNKHTLNDILEWLKKNTRRTPTTLIRHWICRGDIRRFHNLKEIPISERLPKLAVTFLAPTDALVFFRAKLRHERLRKQNTPVGT